MTAALAPKLVAGTLRDAKVVLVATPQAADATADGVQQAMEQAGARSPGGSSSPTTSPTRAGPADAKAYVTGGGQPAGFQLPESEDAGVLSGALLSYALLGSRQGDPAPAVTSEVLAGFASLRMLRVDSAQVTAGRPRRGGDLRRGAGRGPGRPAAHAR